MSQEKLVTNHVINLENKSETCTQCVLHIFYIFFIQVRGEDFAVDLCGVLNLMKPVVLLMVRPQTVNLPPWKIISWFSRVGKILEKCQKEKRSWLGHNRQSHFFQSWQNIGKKSIREEVMLKKRNKAGPNWFIFISRSLHPALDARFGCAVCDPVKHLYQIFDLEKALKYFCNFKVVNGKLVANREDRIKWEVDGAKEFKSLFEVVCNLPHVRALADADDTLQLFPHCSVIVFNRLKVTLEKMVWFGLGSCFNLFVDHKGSFVQELKESNLISMSADSAEYLDQWFSLEFSSGVILKAMLHEENFFASFYNNQIVFESGQGTMYFPRCSTGW